MIISPQAENSCDHKFLYLLTVLGHKKKRHDKLVYLVIIIQLINQRCAITLN